MFCVKCGKEISEGTRFCPYCGNQVTSEGNTPAAPEEKSGNTKKVIIALSAIVAVLVVVVGVLLMNNRGSDNDTSQANTSSVNEDSQTSQTETKEHTPTFDFAVEGYVEIQKGEVDKINVKEYLPDKDMTLTYQGEKGDKTIYYVAPDPNDDNSVEYKHTEEITNYEAVIGGTYYYDENADCLANKDRSLGTDTAYIIPMGKSLDEKSNGVSIQDISYLFTVNTESGIYKDCICVIKIDGSGNTEITIATFYAKGIGEVLSTTNYSSDDIHSYKVDSELISIENGISISEQSTPQSDTNTPFVDTPFYDGWIENNPRFECFETAGGKDVIASFYEENGQIMLKIGDENPVSISYDDAIEGYEGYADDGSHIIIQAVSGNEIEIAGYKDYYGTYIGLPDIDATEG
ncbi:MAG: zinc ribbon domain-containing protein [Oribacterium sp.]|nr:zinc ribbon domain-containing protein [Oribacterium sp.]